MSHEQAVLNDQLLVGAVVFCLGMAGFLAKRNLSHLILSGQVTLQGIWISLTAFSAFHRDENGIAWGLLLLGVAVAQVAMGIALVVLLRHHGGSLDISLWRELREAEPDGVERRGSRE